MACQPLISAGPLANRPPSTPHHARVQPCALPTPGKLRLPGGCLDAAELLGQPRLVVEGERHAGACPAQDSARVARVGGDHVRRCHDDADGRAAAPLVWVRLRVKSRRASQPPNRHSKDEWCRDCWVHVTAKGEMQTHQGRQRRTWALSKVCRILASRARKPSLSALTSTPTS